MSVEIVHTIAGARGAVAGFRGAGKIIGLVPTMGALHAGHGRLIETARAECGAVAVSTFVNPIQFDRADDYERYPRTLASDAGFAEARGADLVFAPEVAEMYPRRQRAYVDVEVLTDNLCGRFRPGHFRGVATVVTKLFNLVQPDLAFFGQKDLQQTSIIRRVVKDLNLPVDILVAPTVREPDGLALSSRNAYLGPKARQLALGISRGLFAAERRFQEGERDAGALMATVHQELQGLDAIQYCEAVDPLTMDALAGAITRPAALCVAVLLDGTRLIDNVLLSPSGEAAQFISHLAS